jgi:metalloendopeptidase OMA1, mitochondrial
MMILRLATVLALQCAFLVGCGAGRAPVPPGTIPLQNELSAEDEKYGHEVLSALTQQFALDTSDEHINRVRDLADRLAIASGNDLYPWHIHVLKDDNIKNAAATRGNYLFVWTGMFKAVSDDTELATIISHEMGHVLAKHTAASPQQEAAQILSGVMGMAASGVLASQGYGAVSDLAQMLVENIFQAALLNPQSQSDELEADQIGLFLMADAGYDPEKALNFWRRVQTDPDFQSASLAFFSTHPSTIERVDNLSKYIATAKERYLLASGQKPTLVNSNHSQSTKSQQQFDANATTTAIVPHGNEEGWVVAEKSVAIHQMADESSPIVGQLAKGALVSGPLFKRRWISVNSPVSGFVRSSLLSPQSR